MKMFKKKLDKSDGRVTYYSKISVDGIGLTAETKRLGEEYLIQYYCPKKIEKDSREAIFHIHHFSQFNKNKQREKLHDTIIFVIDLKNHRKNQPFHLNLSGKSRENLTKKLICPKCRKYFLPLDHFEIISDIGTDVISQYKTINWNKTWDKFLVELKKLGFFKEFSNFFTHSIR